MDYDGAGRLDKDAKKALVYDGYDQLTSVTDNGAALVSHAYGYDGLRTYTKGAGNTEQYWFASDDTLQPGGTTRWHYVKVGDRLVARLAFSHPTSTVAFPPVGATVAWWHYVVQASNGANCNSAYSREKVCGGGTYCDDFESGAAPNWTVSNGTFATALSGSNYVYKQTQTGSTTAGRYAYKASSTANYTVQALVRVNQFGNTTSSSRAGVAARYSNSTTSYTFGLAGNNTLTLQKGYATAITNCAAISFTVTTGTWYALKIVVSGTSIKTYVNGALKHSCTDSGVTAANSASLFTGSGGTPGTLADFDDVFIY
jgi:hypothetical protein